MKWVLIAPAEGAWRLLLGPNARQSGYEMHSRMIRVVVIGSGAREHALVRALRRGGGAREIVAIPGNPGIALEARCAPAQPSLSDAALAESPDLVIVGPEAPLAEGFADRMAQRGVPCFGPLQAAARIESSKAFAKEIMLAAGVPTAHAAVFEDAAAARQHARAGGACVVKLDGLAAGKGVIVADDGAAAAAAVDELWKPGARLLIEERLSGREVSIIALCDGETVVPLPPARDHKRLLDGDRGPNTGGMGAVCPPSDATEELVDSTVRTILEPTARELARRGAPFVGALYAGLMLTTQGPRVLEFNCRLGDPEAQAILLRLRSDPLPLFFAAAQRRLAGQRPGGQLDRLLLGELSRLFLATLGGVVIVYLVIDFADRAHTYTGRAWGLAAAELYANKAAVVAYQLAPVALIISASLLVTLLSRRGELTALFALGVRPLRLAAPIAVFAAILGLALVLLGERVVVGADARAEEIRAARPGTPGPLR